MEAWDRLIGTTWVPDEDLDVLWRHYHLDSEGDDQRWVPLRDVILDSGNANAGGSRSGDMAIAAKIGELDPDERAAVEAVIDTYLRRHSQRGKA